MKTRIDRASEEDLEEIYALLDRVSLPREGLREHLKTALVARSGDHVIGCGTLELYGSEALLRSVAVEPSFQGRGLGKQLMQSVLDFARKEKVKTVYLLTESASGFFARLGFRPVSRADVSATVKQSVQFVEVCCESAQAMVKKLS
jgi:amino-acid N-acetyltransferase